MFKEGTPDFSFMIVENSSNKPNVRSLYYQGRAYPHRGVKPLKANDDLWTPLEINNLMSDSLEIIAPMGDLTEVSGDSVNSDGFGAYSYKGINPNEYYPSGIWFSPDFPEFLIPKEEASYTAPTQVPTNAITWGVVRMEPGTVSGPPFRGTQEIRPRHREYLAIFGDTNKQYLIDNTTRVSRSGKVIKFIKMLGQHYDMLIQYNIWSKSNYEVELLTHWFLDYMAQYRGMFREAGVQNMHLWSRVRDDTLVQMKNGYHVRSVLYYFRTEELTVESESPINRINLNVDVDTFISTELENQYLNLAESRQRILEKWTRNT